MQAKRWFRGSLGVCFLLSAVAPIWADTHTITLDPTQRFQSIVGWGAASASSGSSDPAVEAQWRQDYVNLGMNILRMPMSKSVLVDPSGDMSIPVSLSTDLNANIAKMNFNDPAVSGYGNFAAWLSSHQSNAVIEGDVWSVPHWMKGPTGQTQQYVGNPPSDSPAFATPWLSGNYNHWYNGGPPGNPHYVGNVGDSIGGRLKTEDPSILQQYGQYMAAWVSGFQKQYGVPISVLNLQNESSFENPFDSMTMIVGPNGQTDYTQYAKALKSVRDAWTQNHLTTKIIGPSVGNIGPTIDSPWGLNTQMSMIQAVKNDSDPTLINFLSYYNSNYYMGTNESAVKAIAGYYHGSANVPGNWASWTNAPGVAQDHKGIWYSETGDGGPAWLDAPNTPGAGAITVALKMHNALVFSNASSYVYWQMTDGASEDQYSLLGQNHIADPTQSKKYDAFGQFSKFVTPGATRIGASFENGQSSIGGADAYDTANGLDVSSYFNDATRTLTIVLINMQAGDSAINLNIPGGLTLASLHAYETSGADNLTELANLNVINGAVSFDAPGFSVITLSGVVPEPGALALVLSGGWMMCARRHRGEIRADAAN